MDENLHVYKPQKRSVGHHHHHHAARVRQTQVRCLTCSRTQGATMIPDLQRDNGIGWHRMAYVICIYIYICIIYSMTWLVVWLPFFIFPYIGLRLSSQLLLIFFRGFFPQPPTSSVILILRCKIYIYIYIGILNWLVVMLYVISLYIYIYTYYPKMMDGWSSAPRGRH